MVTATSNEKRMQMWGFKAIMLGFLGVFMLGGLTQAHAASLAVDAKERSVSGVISSIDVKLGKMHLEGEVTKDKRHPTEFNLNLETTRVTDPTDTKFLVVKDLQVGQHVTVEFEWLPYEAGEVAMARKITAEPMPEPILQEAIGELEAMDVQAGTLIISQKPSLNEVGRGNLYYFVFEPSEIVVMKTPSMDPVQLVLKPGDIVKVVYVVKEGRRHASSITLLSEAPVTTSTTTTTTTTVTDRKIVAEPIAAEPTVQEATGMLESIDAREGTLIIAQNPLPNETTKGELFYFVFEPNTVIVMKAPSTQPVELILNPGDTVKVEFVVRDGKRHVRSITLISASTEITSTTKTTTTVTTTR